MNSNLSILLAEDNADDVFLLQEAFKKSRAPSRLHVVRDGLEVLEYLSGEGIFNDRIVYPMPDVLLLDLNMPRMNGFEVLEQIRQDAKCGQLIVHVLSASSRDEDVERAYRLGANSYVVKPARVDQLIALVAAMHEWHRFLCLPATAEGANFLPASVHVSR